MNIIAFIESSDNYQKIGNKRSIKNSNKNMKRKAFYKNMKQQQYFVGAYIFQLSFFIDSFKGIHSVSKYFTLLGYSYNF